MSRKAVSLSVADVMGWDDRKCLDWFIQVRWGSRDTIQCPHCGTVGKHYWRVREKRWKCSGCDSAFSVTSGTLFAHRKKSLREIIVAVLMWINSAAGQPALELKRHMNTTYNTAFVLQQKMREAMVRGFNVGMLSGDLEMDGAHQSGRRSAEKRGRPQGSRPVDKETDKEKLSEIMLTQTGQMKAKKNANKGARDPEFGRRLPEDRRILFSVRQCSGQKGKGACATRVAIGLVPSAFPLPFDDDIDVKRAL
jgi:transposase-like protein